MTRTNKAMLTLAAGGLGLWLASRVTQRHRHSFADRVVFITGGSRGLGLMLARKLTRDGARVGICARDRAELDRAADVLATLGSVPVTAVADVTDPEQIRAAIHKLESERGPIDMLINNAGVITVGPLETMEREDFEEALAISFWGAYNAVQAVLPSMRRRGTGRIVNISSVGGKIGVPHLAPYCVGKFALAGYTQALRADLGRDGISVTGIYPGLMRTGSPRNAHFKGRREVEYAWFKVSDALPGLTVSAEQAAIEILDAARRGDAEHVISLPAQVGVMLNALAPALTSHLTSLASRLLPAGGDSKAMPGRDIELPPWIEYLAGLADRAALHNNEVA